MPVKNKKSAPIIHQNENLPILYVDGAFVNHRDDGISYISLVAGLPEYNAEQLRFIVNDKRLKSIIDVLCNSLNYYPEKPKSSK